jgi:hypothetical protein
MKGELVKRQDRYDLYGSDSSKIASSAENPFGKLSKENCDAIFGIFDVEKLFLETPHTIEDEKDYWKIRGGYIEGFNKAIELKKDKLFTLGDMRTVYNNAINNINNYGEPMTDFEEDFLDTVKSLQQPTEIEVMIEQTLVQSSIQGEAIWKLKLDENDCLILKQIDNV